MSTAETPKPADLPTVVPAEPAPAPVVVPVVATEEPATPAEVPATTEELPKTESEIEPAAPVEETKAVKPEEKVVEPIHSGALGYKAPGLKNAFRFSKKYFWFGEEPVPAANLSQYLRGEKPEVAHPVIAWSSQTGKGLLFFVKHADQKENPAGALNLAYATDLAKDGYLAFALKLSGHKHAFEAQSVAERDGWFVAVEKAIADAKEAKEGIESSEGYKEHKEKISKPSVPAAAAVASSSTPKKSTDVAPKAADSEVPAAEAPAVVPTRTGSSSSSSSDEDKKAKKKGKSRSVSRGKRASIFGGLLGKKDKDAEVAKAETDVKEESSGAPQIGEPAATAPLITTDIPKPSEELKSEVTADPVISPILTTPAPTDENKVDETPAKAAEEKPKPAKRASIFGSMIEKLKSPKEEKKEHDHATATPAIKEAEPVAETSTPLEEAQVAAPADPVAPVAPVAAEDPVVPEASTEAAAPKTEDTKETKAPIVATPSKEKESFSFGKFFGSKERAKSPAAEKATETKADGPPKLEDPLVAAPVIPESTPAVEPTPVAEPVEPAVDTKAEPAEGKKDDAPTPKAKRGSIFGQLQRSLSKATGKTAKKDVEKKEKLPETSEEAKSDAPVVADKPTEATDAPVVAPVEKTIGDVPAEAVTVGEPKSAPAVATT